MAKQLQRQGYVFYACERCGFAYEDAATADKCGRFDLENGMRSADITGEAIAPPDRYWQAVTKFMDEEAKAAKKAAAAPKPTTGATAAPGAASPAAPAGGAPAKPAPPKLTAEELEARKKAALEKAAAMKAQKEAQAQG